MKYKLKELLDIPRLRGLLESFDEIHSMPSAIIDIDGNILIANSWQDICTQFHRIHPETERKCIESDTHIQAELDNQAPSVVYRCPMGLVDSATPLLIEGEHLGNVFTGQLFLETPDEKRFVEQARRYGFPEEAYLEAMRKVPYFSEENLHRNLKFIHGLTQMLAEQGLQNKRLQESEARLNQVAEQSRTYIWEVDRQGLFTYVSDGAEAVIGYRPEELVGRIHFYDLHPESERERFKANAFAVFGRKDPFKNFESNIDTKTGQTLWINTNGIPILDADGNLLGYRGSDYDITERKQSELALRESERRILEALEFNSSILRTSSIGILTYRGDGQCIFANQAAALVVGTTVEDLLEQNFHRIESWKECGLYELACKAFRTGKEERIETRLRTSFGKEAAMSVRFSTFPSRMQKCLLMFAQDITERKAAESALEESEARLKLAEQAAGAGCWEINIEDGAAWWSGELFRLFGLDPEKQQAGMETWRSVIHPEDLPTADVNLQESIREKKQHFSEYRIVLPDGRIRWIGSQGSTLCDAFGMPRKLAGIGIDITRRKQAEAELREALAFNQNIIDSAQEGIFVYDRELRYQLMNRYMEKHTGMSFSEVKGKTPEEVFPFMAESGAIDDLRRILEGEEFNTREFQDRIPRAGRHGWVVQSNTPLKNAGGDVIGVVGMVRDITEQKKTLDQLTQAQKMESVGRLAGGVAHDFNNMLGVILGHTEMALMNMEETNPLHSGLVEVREAAQRSSDLTRQLLAFARKQAISPQPLNLNDKISSLLKMLQRLIGEDIRLNWQAEANLWQIRMDPSQIDQVLANLCVNSRDAIDNTGFITIETSNCTIDSSYCREHLDALPGDYVRMVVSDNGRGMDHETQAHIFEPFFTTKPAGDGTGLGLATVFGIVKQNEGFLQVYSEPGRGTSFSIYLPRFETEEPSAPAPAPVETTISRGNETILLVEDEHSVLKVATLFLGRQGYNVLPAPSPQEAIRISGDFAGRIDLLISDVIMPDMSGRELADLLLAARPEMKHLFMSGYTANVISRHGVLNQGVNFIEKPFSLPNLINKVREVLDKE